MPTVLRVGRYRFHFFSNEGQEPSHIHVQAVDDQAKFWLEPKPFRGGCREKMADAAEAKRKSEYLNPKS